MLFMARNQVKQPAKREIKNEQENSSFGNSMDCFCGLAAPIVFLLIWDGLVEEFDGKMK